MLLSILLPGKRSARDEKFIHLACLLRASAVLIFCLFLVYPLGQNLHAQVVQAPHVEVELVSDSGAVTPGESFWVALRFDLEEDWHIYWKNPGDSGLAPSVKWNATDGVAIEDISWPLPERIPFAHLVNYGYEGEVFLPVKVNVSQSLRARKINIRAEADWLVCKEDCIPGDAVLSLELPVVSKHDAVTQRTEWSAPVQQAVDNLPIVLDELEVAVQEDEEYIFIEFQSGSNLDHVVEGATFFPAQSRLIENAAEQILDASQEPYVLKLQKARNNTEPLTRLSGILHSHNGWGTGNNAALIDISFEDEEGSLALAQEASPSDVGGRGIWLVFAFAFLGGLVLNAMPCVFPVISIKILSFVKQAGEDPAKVRAHGLMFAVGVIVSFLALGLLLFLLRAGGAELGWGFQLQSPIFIALMAFLFTFLGLVFLGVLDIGYKIQNVAGSVSSGTGLSGSFFNGVLATAIASPCTAPFMGYALAIAVAVPIGLGLLIFFSLGLGMASPYILLSFAPALLKYLPRPGGWMETFKQIMAFPLLATVIWLLSVYGQQLGFDAAIKLLSALFVFCFGLFLYGSAVSGSWKKLSGSFSLLLCIISLLYVASDSLYMPQEISKSESGVYLDEHGIQWQAFSPELYLKLMQSEKPVYIDFTAAWCITCIVNKKVVFSSARVREKLKLHEVVMVRADWTSRDSRITEALAGYGRNGVPLNVIYGADKTVSPIILPTLLTPNVVQRNLEEILEVN